MHKNAGRLFSASCVALIVTAMTFAIRGNIMDQLGQQFHLSATELGWVVGTAFWGFTLSMLIGGSLCDVVGMGRILALAFVGHLAGILLTIFAQGFWSLFVSTLFVGLANGCVEAAANPMVATLYPDNKTTKLNHFHAWWPGGLVIGGIVAYALDKWHVGWQIQIATMLVPTFIYGAAFLGQEFPATERVTSGVSTASMFAECGRPLYLFMICCMAMTAITENGTNQWIPYLLQSPDAPGILVFSWVASLMTVGRLFAGPVVHKINPTGMLVGSSAFAALGLYSLSLARGPMAFAAAVIYAMGVCYFWPTMLGFVSERLPKSGAVGLSVMGGAGMLSASFALPAIGKLYDKSYSAAISQGASREAAQAAGGSGVLGSMVILPCILIVAFTALMLQQRGKEHP